MNTNDTNTVASLTTSSDPTTDPTTDFALFQTLKPYIGHCLTMNHDINNPLAGIIGYCEFLQLESENLNKDQQHQLEMIAKCAERIRKLVENLCEEKIALTEKIDLRPIVDSYKAIAKKLD
jgi:nitrogen-specific signal transduction histidine kinase